MNNEKVEFLFNNNVEFVKKLAYRMKTNNIDVDDLIQVGLMGLYQAARNYNEKCCPYFLSYASYYILGEMKKELRNNQLIPINKELARIIQYLKNINNNQSIDELSKIINCSKENLLMALTLKENMKSLNDTIDNIELISLVCYQNDNCFNNEKILESLKTLDKKSLDIIKQKYFYNINQEEIAKKYH